MILDSSDLSGNSVLSADIAIVGAGPAGIVLACELAKAGFDVLLVESGRLAFSSDIQRLGDPAHYDPKRHGSMAEATRRQLGGASNIWGGRCVPFDPVDFDHRSFVACPGWPVTYEELAPFFQKACDWFVCGDATFDARLLPRLQSKTLVPGLPDGDVLSSTLERWSLPTNFGREYEAELRRSARLRLISGFTCREILTDEAGARVTSLELRDLAQREIRVTANKYVLACGGLETTRLMLASDRHHPGGVGNHSDHLGRYYMGHLSGRIARIRFETPPDDTIYAHERDGDGVYVRRRLSFSREFLLENKLLNIVGWLVNPEIADPAHQNGILSFAFLALTSPLGRYFAPEAIRKSLTKSGAKRQIGAHLWNVFFHFWTTLWFAISFGYRRFLPRRRVPGFFVRSGDNSYLLHYHAEQAPQPESRVVLTTERDAVGLRKLNIDLRFCEQDVDTVLRAHEQWDAYLRRHQCGRLEYLTSDPAAAVWEQAYDGFHQAGTARMSADPAEGVVDPNLAVHGIDNLFVASSAVFPTSGQANSTFMIVVFALRLVEHLKRCLVTEKGGEISRNLSN